MAEVTINDIDYSVDYVDSPVDGEAAKKVLNVDFVGGEYASIIGRSLNVDFSKRSLNIQLVEMVNYNVSPGWSTKTTMLEITESVEAGKNFFVNSSGTYYLMTLDVGDLRSSAIEFLNSEAVQIFLNGVQQVKQVDVIWSSRYSFYFNIPTDLGDHIKVLS